MGYILALDQGTTSSRAIVFDARMRAIAVAQHEFPQYFPASGWVEHAPQDLWDTTARSAQQAVAQAGLTGADIAGIGITNQRETTLLWDAETGECLHNAIVWQDRRTADLCDTLRAAGLEQTVRQQTGLLLDPYFSGTKLKWLLENVAGARARAEAGKLRFGTVDCYLIWKLTGGRVHATDATNAARTLLFDIHTGDWSPEICAALDIPRSLLPEVRDCAADFGETDLLGARTPILGVAGDQQAATIGQACFQPGMMKSTYGTGCFALFNTGEVPVMSENKLLTTIAYQLDGRRTYALEGSIFIAGAVVQWLRDGLGILEKASESGALARAADPAQDLVIVPAFTGLGAPYWAPQTRGAVFGLTRNSGPAEFARAALESVGLQTRDLLEAMRADWPSASETVLRVDGGMAASDWTMQFLADILGAPVDRPQVLETTARGAAWLAGMRTGLYPDRAGFAAGWAAERRFDPQMPPAARVEKYARWKRAVAAAMTV
ncbi:MAG: glycerol kinase [Rhodobacteraceae bacterium]|nr:glycerol kinase [Paracoccaceae bacterium]MBT26758.1 glycerol kinase [Paracoccaceae bacterium]